MDLQSAAQLFVIISFTGMAIYAYIRNKQIEDKFSEKPHKAK